MAKFINEWEYLIHLLNCVLKKEQPGELPESLSFDRLFSLADSHSVANMAYYGVEKLSVKPSEELRRKWAEVRDKALSKDIIQEMELEMLTSAFTQAQIPFITLKGTELKKLYPQSDFRTMSDIDIYIDDNNADGAKKAMLSIGYEINSMEQGVHDVYYKKPVMNVEVHRDLFGNEGEEFSPIFENIWEMAEKVKGTRHNLSAESSFMYIMAHGIKHYNQGGTGLRSFMDIHIFLKHHNIDTEKLYPVFEKVGAGEEYRIFLDLAAMWFGEKEFNPEMRKAESYVISSGTYGNFENMVTREMEGQNKAGYLLKKIFPSLKYMREQYPVLRRVPVLLPFCWVVRWIKAVTVNRKHTAVKFRTFKKN